MKDWTTQKKVIAVVFGLALIPVLWFGYWGAKLLITAKKEGFLDAPEKRVYSGNSMENLRAIHVALSLYHDSEGAFPVAEGWMDAAWSRMQAADMVDDEAKKKLKSEGITADDEFGYAFNDAVSGKHKLDVENPEKTPLVFDSEDLAWNAHGKPDAMLPNPPRPSGNKVLTVSGAVISASK